MGDLTPADRGAYLFNRGKALTILGRLAEADASYLAAAKEAYGVALGSYGKAVTALRELPQELVQQLEEVGVTGGGGRGLAYRKLFTCKPRLPVMFLSLHPAVSRNNARASKEGISSCLCTRPAGVPRSALHLRAGQQRRARQCLARLTPAAVPAAAQGPGWAYEPAERLQ